MKRKLLSMLLVIGLIITLIPSAAFAAEEGTDNGELDGYIEIRTAKDLYNIRSDMTANYKLMNDIDLTEATAPGGIYDFNGCGWNPIGSNNTYSNIPFTGVFDGQGYTIKGMRIHVDQTGMKTNNYVALFAKNEGTIKNLKMKDASVYFSTSVGIHNIYAAVLAAENTGLIENVSVENGSVYANNTHTQWYKKEKYNENYYVKASGIANGIHGNDGIEGTMRNCYNSATIRAAGTGDSYEYWDSYYYKSYYYYTYALVEVNGICAKNVSGCVNEGEISCLGGSTITTDTILGSEIDNSYDASGWGKDFRNTVTNCYYLKKGSSSIVGYYKGNSSSGWIGLNDAQMQDPDFFEGFDFANTWRMSDETVYKYPQLQSIRNGVTKVEIVSEPTNEIVVGTTLKYEGAVARIFREDGSTEDVTLTPDNTTGGSTSTTGVKTVTYTYKGASASFDIDVLPVRVSSLQIKSLPTKVDYVEGQTFNKSGLVVNAIYNNGDVKTCNDYLLSDVDPSIVGKQTVTVSYNGKSASFDVNYIAKAITDLKITKNPTKTVYDEGEAFDPTGMVVTAYYNDDTSVNVTDYTVGTMTGYGAVKLPITYGGFTVNVDVTIRKLVKSVSFSQESLELFEGGSAKLAVTVDPEDADNNELVWTSGDTKVAAIGSDGTVTAIGEGNTVVTAAVKENPNINAVCSVKVLKIKPETLVIKSLPDKMVYLEGEEFDPSGLSVDAINNDKSEETNVEFTLSKPDTTPGKKTVMVFYQGIATSFEIEYVEKKVTELKITSLPEKCKYLEGEEFDPAGLEVTLVYSGRFEEECKDYTISEVTPTVGTKTVEVSLGEVKTSFKVVYYSKEIRSLTVTKMPVKTTYKEGEAFDPTGLEVTAVYDGGITKVINDYSVGSIEGSGNVSIDISCGNVHTEVMVTVEATGGLNELLELLEGESSHTVKNSDCKVWVSGEYLYLSCSFYDVWNLDQSICWKIDKNTGNATVDYSYTKYTSKTQTTTVKGTAMVETKTYYPGMMLSFSCSALQKREGDEFNLLGSKFVSDGTLSINEFLMDRYNISLTKSGFDSLLSTKKEFEKSEEEVEELSKLTSVLSTGDISFTQDGYKNSIHYDPGTGLIEFKISKTEYVSSSQYTNELKYSYNTKALFHYADFTFRLTVKSPSTGDRYYQFAGYADAAMMSNIYLRCRLTKTDVSDMERQYFASEIDSYGEMGDPLAGILMLHVNSYLAKNYEIDMTKCGWYHMNSKVCQTHTWGSKRVITEATYKQDGLYEYTCTKCGKTKTEVVPKLVCTTHAWDSGKVVKAATTSNTGIKKYTCKNCGVTKQSTIPKLQTGWVTKSGKKYYYNKNGVKQKGLTEIGKKWYYFDSNGVMQTGWKQLSKKWYYFNASGVMQTGWQQISKKWYYFNANGEMQTGWQKLGGKWYYFNASGVMLTGWQKIGGKWYYLKAGVMVSGWQKIGKYWYFFASGVMKTGWMKSGGKWYYFGTDGAMVTGSKKIGSKTYKFDSNGVCQNP